MMRKPVEFFLLGFLVCMSQYFGDSSFHLYFGSICIYFLLLKLSLLPFSLFPYCDLFLLPFFGGGVVLRDL